MIPAKQDDIEVARGDLDQAYLQQRIADWKDRIDAVYAEIKSWAARHGAGVEDGPSVLMHEDLMKRYGLSPERLPSLVVRSGEGLIKVQPRGLWTIGANGRIDLVTTRGLYMLVDYAEPLAEPDWRIYGPDRREGRMWSEEAFFGLI